MSPVPLCCPPLPKSLSTKWGGGGEFPSLTLLPGTEDRAGAVGVPDCGPRQGSPQWEVNEHHLGYHDLFLLHCLQRQVGTTWHLVGARMGGRSCQMTGPEELEWGTAFPENPPGPSPPVQCPRSTGQAALWGPSFSLGSCIHAPKPRGSLPG